MHRRSRWICLLLASGVLAAGASPSRGAERPESIQIAPEPAPLLLESEPPAVMATCSVGETRVLGAVNGSFGLSPGLTYYTLLDPASCSACSGGVMLRSVSFRVRTNTVCSFPVEVSIVGARSGPGCREPDPAAVRCGPVAADIAPPSTANDFASVPLPGDCCIDQVAFLRIRLVSTGTCTGLDPFWGFASFNTCVDCRSFIELPPSPPFDACTQGFGNPLQWVEADCCSSTPVLRGSWGQLKVLYR